MTTRPMVVKVGQEVRRVASGYLLDIVPEIQDSDKEMNTVQPDFIALLIFFFFLLKNMKHKGVSGCQYVSKTSPKVSINVNRLLCGINANWNLL